MDGARWAPYINYAKKDGRHGGLPHWSRIFTTRRKGAKK
jgi:hypothetical protein